MSFIDNDALISCNLREAKISGKRCIEGYELEISKSITSVDSGLRLDGFNGTTFQLTIAQAEDLHKQLGRSLEFIKPIIESGNLIETGFKPLENTPLPQSIKDIEDTLLEKLSILLGGIRMSGFNIVDFTNISEAEKLSDLKHRIHASGLESEFTAKELLKVLNELSDAHLPDQIKSTPGSAVSEKVLRYINCK
jgi:hypothetical protein